MGQRIFHLNGWLDSEDAAEYGSFSDNCIISYCERSGRCETWKNYGPHLRLVVENMHQI